MTKDAYPSEDKGAVLNMCLWHRCYMAFIYQVIECYEPIKLPISTYTRTVTDGTSRTNFYFNFIL